MRIMSLPVALLALAACEKPAPTIPEGSSTAGNSESGMPKIESSGTLDRSHAGTPMPGTPFLDPEGQTVALDQIGDKPLLLNLWATWCAPCVVEMPTLDALARRDGHRIEVLAVSQDLEGKAKVDAFFAKESFQALQPYVDKDAALSAELKVQSLPTTIYYGRDGKELWRITGIEDWRGDKAAKLLAEAQ